ncbi:MAG: choline dehydrogenase [Rhodanobacteraceae bacterium]|nr:MAG: choline dehydrogenase [Rhodanobacteraceae bacterium]
MQFDYVIVGAGSAGCVLADRLTANPNTRVCLLEAGPSDDSLMVRIPSGIILLMRSRKRNWRYWTVPQRHLDNRRLYIPRGKTLGGSSAVNAMCHTRGHRWDYDHWAALGNPGWGYADVLPVFKRSEHYESGATAFHGVGGPLNVAELRFRHPVSAAFVAACIEAGYPASDDFNGEVQEGVGFYQVTQQGGERCSVARAYLHPVLDRANLTVLTGALAERVVLDGKRAVGVAVSYRGATQTIEAGAVIVCGGAINSPQLLKLSGIGNARELAQSGIRVLHDLPGVGENLQDHPDVLVVHQSLRRDTMTLGSPLAAIKGLWDFLQQRRGELTSNAAEAGGFIKTRTQEPIPDAQLHLTAGRLDNHGLNWRFSLGHGYSCHVSLLRPRSRGSIRLRDANPRSPALIDPDFLDHPDDVEGMLRGLRAVRRILAQDALAPWRGAEIFPGRDAQGDAELRAYLRRKCDNIYHPVGTCKMGVDDMAVVDPDLRVHGIDGLRVVDASIMPTLIGGNTNAPTVMIAEHAADKILSA